MGGTAGGQPLVVPTGNTPVVIWVSRGKFGGLRFVTGQAAQAVVQVVPTGKDATLGPPQLTTNPQEARRFLTPRPE
jgi:hypothetical protein